MLQAHTPTAVQEVFTDHVTNHRHSPRKDKLPEHDADGKLKANIPDVCQHKPFPLPISDKNMDSKKLADKETGSSAHSSDAELESCSPTKLPNGSCQLSANEEKMNQVTSQARLVRQNSLRLVAKSPKIHRRATPISELDRKWALNQCEELTTWVNSLLQQRKETLESDLKKSMGDGRTLPLLVSIISNEFQLATSPSKNQQEQFERTRCAIEHLKHFGYTTELSALDIVNGDLKSVILFLSGLKTFVEQREKTADTAMKSSVVMRRSTSQDRSQSRGQGQLDTSISGNATSETRAADASVSERLKRILKEPTAGVNVDNREPNKNNIREQPVGESDSAASPTSYDKDHFHGYYSTQKGQQHLQQTQRQQQNQRQQQQNQWQQHGQRHQQTEQQPHTSPAHHQHPQQHSPHHQQQQQHTQQQQRQWHQQDRYQRGTTPQQVNNQQIRQEPATPKTLPHTKRSQGPVQYNNSVPNLHTSEVDRNQPAIPRSMTPTPRSNRLSIYNTQGDYTDRSPAPNGVAPKPANETSPPEAKQPEMYPQSNSMSPYARRRQLPPSPTSRNHYETIDEVKGQTGSLPEYIVRGVERQMDRGEQMTHHISRGGSNEQTPRPMRPTTPSNAVPVGSYEQPSKQKQGGDECDVTDLAIAPDAQYETSSRRVSMPAVRYRQPSPQYKPAVLRKSTSQRPDLYSRPLTRSNDSDDGDYVDISDDDDTLGHNGDLHNGSSTPPLPALLIEDDVEDAEPSYKCQRSLSASAKLLSTGVESFQHKLKAAKEQAAAQLEEETEEDDEDGDSGQFRVEMSSTQKVPAAAENINDVVRQSPSCVQQTAVDTQTDGEYRQLQYQRLSSRENRSKRNHKLEGDERPQDYEMDHKVNRLERLYEDMSNYLHVSKSHRHRDSRRHSIASASSSQYSYSHKHRRSRTSSDAKSIQKRFHRLEAHIVTLAKSVAHLSTEINTQNSIFSEMDRISGELDLVKQHINSGAAPTNGQLLPQSSHLDGNTLRETNPLKIGKLTRLKSSLRRRFFGQEPPLMRIFLKQLGYEKYQSLFDAENIGMLELPYMSEEKLRTIGIPLGPRVRILQEAMRLCTSPPLPSRQTRNNSSSSARVKNKF